MKIVCSFLTLLTLIGSVWANVEKAIFLGPSSLHIPTQRPNLYELYLQNISPAHHSLRTYLSADFPDPGASKGKESWFLLKDLTEGQRYEIRICWAATQPTQFWIYLHTLSEVFESLGLITSLTVFSEARQKSIVDFDEFATLDPHLGHDSTIESLDQSSVLFLQVYSAADYYTTNETLMHNVPPVIVDINGLSWADFTTLGFCMLTEFQRRGIAPLYPMAVLRGYLCRPTLVSYVPPPARSRLPAELWVMLINSLGNDHKARFNTLLVFYSELRPLGMAPPYKVLGDGGMDNDNIKDYDPAIRAALRR
ncbi:MAG: hypothetical protein M1834_009052 [Cirrosporium novae-zelandiae]|nr:MAG: hypothetical protein M1834_009052 [Cirrosporium novae-zelandiae]